MTTRSAVAVLRTRPETVLEDYQRLFEMAGGAKALRPNATTILKDNITWHFPMPGCNTTPWQLEDTILALRRAGLTDLVCVLAAQIQEPGEGVAPQHGLGAIVRSVSARGIPCGVRRRPQTLSRDPRRASPLPEPIQPPCR